MKLIDLKDGTPANYRVYLVHIKTAFNNPHRTAYAEWTDAGFILLDTVLFNDEYIYGFYNEWERISTDSI